jgi:hypothetical protein
VLGAGNCNDLNLTILTRVFDEIHLVDLDGEALAAGLSRQRVASRSGVVLHGGVDLAGLAEATARQNDPADTDALLRACHAHHPGLLETSFDVVLSAGLLTQLIDTASTLLARESSPEFVLTVRTAHLRILVDVLRPGGSGVLVTELVSSDTFPELNRLPAHQLGAAARKLIDDRNFFTGTNPIALTRLLASDPHVTGVRLTEPWLWHLGAGRSYLAYALTFRTVAT